MKELLEKAGYINISFIDKENSEEIIRNWNFGEGVEKAVYSVYIKAFKPGGRPTSA